MRGYHHFSTNRSRTHILVALCILMFPVVSLFVFSLLTKISFFIAIHDLSISVGRLGIAFVIATILAWLLVVFFIRGKTENPAIALFDILQSLPTFAILPIAVHYLGHSEATIIFFLVLTIIWPIIFSIISSLKQVSRSWREAITISRISGFQYIRYFLLPVTTPGIVTGAIIGLGEGWEALIATELLLNTERGLGPFFGTFSDNTIATLMGVFVFLSLIFVINKFVWLPLLEKSHRLVEQ
jgi:ABC-type nitrate/sulfonate/bicarbonate transport system permease component